MKVLVLSFMFLIVNVFAQEESAAPEKSDKKYSEAELKEAIALEVDRRLRKVRSKNIANYSTELFKKEEQLQMKELEIKKREEQLSLNEKDLQKKLSNFKSQQDKVLGCIDENLKESKDRISHMVKVISTMKPANAAKVLSVQDAKISVQIIELLDPAKVSKIFNLMEKEVSARLQKQFINMKK